MEARRSIEERIEQLENLIYQTKNVLTFDEAARFLGFSKSYLYKLTAANRIPYYKPQNRYESGTYKPANVWSRRRIIISLLCLQRYKIILT